MILKQDQARGIYDSICIANNLGGSVNVKIGSHTNTVIELSQDAYGRITIDALGKLEQYADQCAFASAYGLQ